MKLLGVNTASLPYFFWRIAYITIKPLTILLAAKLLDSGSASLISLAIVISGTLMASLSFGTYRLLFRTRGQPLRSQRAEILRKGTFLLNSTIVCILGAVATPAFGVEAAAFVAVFVITEHVIHDESRTLLYAGSREKWARENCLRTLFVLAIPLVVYLSKESVSLLVALMIAAAVNTTLSVMRGGLFRVPLQVLGALIRPGFYRSYRRQFNYFISATLNRLNQQSDRYIFSLVSFETLWIYSLVAQIGNLPLMFFEMSHMSKLKESVASQTTLRFQWLPRKQILTLTAVSAFAILIYAFIGVTTPEFVTPVFMVLLLSILAVNFIASAAMFNGERLFWAMNDAKRFARLEMSAFGAGLLAAAPVAVSGILLFANVPKALSLIIRLRNSYRWLRS